MVTEFGKFIRILRISSDISAKDMAEMLDVSTSYLSAVENGKRSIPVSWEQKIIKGFNLDADSCAKLRQAIADSYTVVKVDLSEVEDKKRQLLMSIARDDIDDDTLQRAIEIIKKSTTKGDK